MLTTANGHELSETEGGHQAAILVSAAAIQSGATIRDGADAVTLQKHRPPPERRGSVYKLINLCKKTEDSTTLIEAPG